MEYIDITLPLSAGTPAFPGDPKVRFEPLRRDGYRITSICISSHSGTHVDAPLHYIEGGPGVDEIPLESLNGESVVIDLTSSAGHIGKDDLAGKTEGLKILILKTGFSHKLRDIADYIPLNRDCAEYIAGCGITCVVTDAPSVEAFDGDGTVHRTLLENNVIIIEMADLSGVDPGIYFLNAMPLRLEGCDGAPVRAVLFKFRGD